MAALTRIEVGSARIRTHMAPVDAGVRRQDTLPTVPGHSGDAYERDHHPVSSMSYTTVQDAEMVAGYVAAEWGHELRFWLRDSGVPHIASLAACRHCDGIVEIRGLRHEAFVFRGDFLTTPCGLAICR